MIEFFVFAVPLAMAAALLIAAPLWRRERARAGRTDFDLAVFRDQLAEIDRDAERGLLGPAEAEAARLEVQRRILAVGGESAEKPSAPTGGRVLVYVAAVAAPLAAAIVYTVVGTPGMPDFPFAQRSAARTAGTGGDAEARLREQIPDLDAAVERLAGRLKDQPDDMRGWMMLGRTYMTLGRHAEAAAAFATARRAGGGADAGLQQAEALMADSPDAVPPEAAKLLEDVVATAPGSITGRYYLGLAKGQRGDFRGAAQDFADVVALSPADAEWLPSVKEQLAFAANEAKIAPESLSPSPVVRMILKQSPPKTAEPAAPAPSSAPADQQEMIRGMVERLAQRLKENPNDADGWRMLARSYEVLGETDKAKEALAKANALAK